MHLTELQKKSWAPYSEHVVICNSSKMWKKGDFSHHYYLLLQLFNDTHANLKWDLKTLLKQSQLYVTQSLIQGMKNFPILRIYAHLFKVRILVAKLKNRESDCQCKNTCNMSDFFRYFHHFRYYFEFDWKAIAINFLHR